LLELLRQGPLAASGSVLVFALNLVRADDAKPDQRARLGAAFEKTLRLAGEAGHITFAAMGSLPELKRSEIKTWAEDDRVRPRLQLPLDKVDAELAESKSTLPMKNFVDRARAKLA
jgi:hypothetical protein